MSGLSRPSSHILPGLPWGKRHRSLPLNELWLHSNTSTKKWVSNDQLGAHSTVCSGRKYLTMVIGYISVGLILYGIQLERKKILILFDMPRQSSNNYRLQVTILASDDHRGHASFPVHLRSPARKLSTPASHTVHCSSQQTPSCRRSASEPPGAFLPMHMHCEGFAQHAAWAGFIGELERCFNE